MATYLAEDVETEIAWLLTNSYSGQLATTENSYSDGISLEAVRGVRRIPGGVLLPWEDLPGCLVSFTGRSDFAYKVGSSHIEVWGYDVEVQIGAGMNLSIPDLSPLEIMTRKLRRYEQALLDLLGSRPNLDLSRGGEKRCQLFYPVSTRESPTLEVEPDNLYMQVFRAHFRAQSHLLS